LTENFNIKNHCIDMLKMDLNEYGQVPFDRVVKLMDVMEEYYKLNTKPEKIYIPQTQNLGPGSYPSTISYRSSSDEGQEVKVSDNIGFENKYKPRGGVGEDIFKKENK